MRRARRIATLALVLLVFLGLSEATAGDGTIVHDGRGLNQGVAVVSQAYVAPYYWDPFWYPGFGWGVGYSYGPYGPPPSYGDGHVPPRNAAPVELHVSPRKATVVVDGTNVGQARDFDSRAYPLWLKAGTHELELSYKGHQTLRVKFEVRRGKAYRVRYELRAGSGMDPRSSRKPQEPPAEPGYV